MKTQIVGIKISQGQQTDTQTNQSFSWNNVILYVVHQFEHPSDMYSTYYGYSVESIKINRNVVKINGVKDLKELVGKYVTFNFSYFNGKPVLISVDAVNN